MVIQESMTVMEKLGILADAAKYDVACTSSGTAKKGTGQGSETAFQQASATALQETEGASAF